MSCVEPLTTLPVATVVRRWWFAVETGRQSFLQLQGVCGFPKSLIVPLRLEKQHFRERVRCGGVCMAINRVLLVDVDVEAT